MAFVPDTAQAGPTSRFVPDAPASDPLSVPDSAPPVVQAKAKPQGWTERVNSTSEGAKGIIEAGLTGLTGMTSGLVGRIGGTLGGIAGQVASRKLGDPEASARAAEVAEEAQARGTYQPTSESGRNLLERVGKVAGASKLEGLGPMFASELGVLGPQAGAKVVKGADNAAQAAIRAVNRSDVGADLMAPTERPKAAPKAAPPAGEAAQRVTDELQKIREAMADPKKVRSVGPSEYEVLRTKLDEATAPLREAAFASGAKVEVEHALKVIDRLESQNVDKNVLAALKQARETIEGAVKKSNLEVEIIPTAGGDMMVKNGKLVPAEKGVGARIDMADEVRQSLERQIQSRPDGQPLAKHTQGLLREIQNAVTAKAKQASPEYGKYLEEYAKNAKALDKFDSPDSLLAKFTTTGQPRTGMDAQKKLAEIFKGDRAELHFKELVDLTKHNPEAANGLREAFKDWIMQRDPAGGAKAKDIIERWQGARSAVEKSGFYAPEKFAELDAAMKGIAKSEGAWGVNNAVAGTAGYLAGLTQGHPFGGAYTGKKLSGLARKRSEKKAIDLLEQTMGGTAQ